MNIIVLNSGSSQITGGQIYDSNLYRTILKLSSHNIEFCETKSYSSGINLSKMLCPFLELALLKKIRKKDICFLSSSLAYRHFLLLLIVRIFLPRIKCYVIHHHYQYKVEVGVKKALFKFYELNFLKLSTSVIIPSPYVLSVAKEFLPSNRINYIEISFKENEYSAAKKTINNGDLLYIGTIEPRKGLHLLLDSLFLLKNENIKFIINIIGKIVDNNYYMKLLEKVALFGLQKQVVFHGRVSSEILHNFLMTTELFVFPSLLEGYGMVLIEAMSYGIPVVAFNNSAMPFTIKNGFNGFLAKNEDAKDFKKFVEKVICNRDLRNLLSEGALITYKNSRRESNFINDVKTLISTFQ